MRINNQPAVLYIERLLKMIRVRQTRGAQHKAWLFNPGKNWAILIVHETERMEHMR